MTAASARRSRRRWRAGLALTPLVDVVFILLVFFMLVSQFGQDRGVPVALAGGQAAQDARGAMLLEVRAGDYRLSGQATPDAALPARLAAARAGRDDLRVLVAPGAGVSVQRLAQALDALAAAGVAQVALSPARP